MHPDDLKADACAHSAHTARSPQLVRLLIAAAFGLGLFGLAASGSAAAQPTVAVTSAALQSPAMASFVDVPVRHASRSRAAAARPAPRPAAHPVAHRRAVHRPTWVRPSGAGIVSPYGMRWGRMHKGIDFGASYGSPIRAIGDGVVIGTGYQADEGGYGQITIIRHSSGLYSAYAHQSRMAVHVGQHVTAGQVIGYVGSTGHSTGPHLHFEIRLAPHGGQVNPLRWLRMHHVAV